MNDVMVMFTEIELKDIYWPVFVSSMLRAKLKDRIQLL